MGPSLFPLPFCFLLPLPLHPHLMSCLDKGHLPCTNVKLDSRWTLSLVWIQEEKKEEKKSKRRGLLEGTEKMGAMARFQEPVSHLGLPFNYPPRAVWDSRGLHVKVLPGLASSKRRPWGFCSPFASSRHTLPGGPQN